ncbi:MAG TPA: HEPN domain-containing protein [Pyrinomonadaceae bacterium]|nr:HEPN domain-containing protein [Pyrinomonadaceae bacterium]
MAYDDHFRLADDYISRLDMVMGGIADPFMKSRYTGFLAVSAVTVYELALKTIFQEFAEGKHKVLAVFSSAYFRRINGRIRIEVIRKEYTKRFGDKYSNRFDKKLKDCERRTLQSHRESVKSSYENIITWRNEFAHEGIIPATPTYDEVKKAYTFGKEVIHCLAQSMKR